ncbi:hypothetical protein HKD37_12G034616 [Glycine soja]
MPFITRGFNEANARILQKIRKAWNRVGRKDKELRGSSNGVIGGSHKWLKSRTQGITWLPKLKSLSGKEAEIPEKSEELKTLKAELEKTRVSGKQKGSKRKNGARTSFDEQTKVSALQIEREAKERVIELLHGEAMKWMNRFALTLNESQELPRLLTRAKAVADTYSAPNEVYGFFDYC